MLAEDLAQLSYPPQDSRLAGNHPNALGGCEFSWPSPPQRYPLCEEEIHVWCVSTDVDSSRLAVILSNDERQRLRQYRFEKDRGRFIVRRWLLRTLLGGYLEVEPESVLLVYEARGKPVLSAVAAGRTIHFSASHSEDLALLAFCKQFRIGVDVERVRSIPMVEQIAARSFSEMEDSRFRALPGESRLDAFFSAWTRKEAVLKATGEGISSGLDRVEVTFSPGEEARVLRIEGDETAALHWSLHALSPTAGYVGALAVHENQARPRCWSWHAWPAACR